ncbi:MAG: hypothetical protein ACRDBG_02795 [Waterburya sp.]
MSDTQKKLRLYKSHQPYCQTVSPKGAQIVFQNHLYATDSKEIIEWLDKEIENAHPYFYIDPDLREVGTDYLDPVAQLKKQLRAEIEAELQASGRDFGTYENTGKEKLTSSADIVAVSQGNKADGSLQTLLAQRAASATVTPSPSSPAQ